MTGNLEAVHSTNVIGVYTITCRVNEMVYVGSSSNIGQRAAGHIAKLRSGKHPRKNILADFVKYGEDQFVFAIASTHKTACAAKREEARLIREIARAGRSYNISGAGLYRPRKSRGEYTTLLRTKNRADYTKPLREWMGKKGLGVSDLIQGIGIERMRAYRLVAGTLPNPDEMRALFEWTKGAVEPNAFYGVGGPYFPKERSAA